MKIELNEAQSIIQQLREAKGSPLILQKCQSCFTCNFYCPNGARPASLIIERWHEQYTKSGLKIKGKYYFTHYPNYPNFRTVGIGHMIKKEREILEKWASMEPLKGDTLTYPGCNMILTPTLTQSSIFSELDIRGRLEYCCGETLFRTGYADRLFEVSARLDKWLNQLKPRNLLVLCTAGTNVFRNVLPNYGLTYKFEKITSYIEWLWERIESEQIKITNPLSYSVTIQDSCYSKMFGDSYMDIPRKILEKIGCKIIEMPAIRENMRCCGIAGGFSIDAAYDPFKIRSATCRNLDDARATKADILCVYCSGCLQTYSIAKKLYFKPRSQPIYHIIELIQMAIGETPQRLIKRTASNIYWGIVRHQFPKLLAGKKFKVPEIPVDPHSGAY
jgi:Fe-S oxidoreductase